jgi:hypothetical protein
VADSYIQIGSTGTKKKIVDLGDGTYADAVVVLGSDGGGQIAADELVLADDTASEDGLGKIGTVPDDGYLYVRCDTSTPTVSAVDWRVQSDKIHDVQLYKARSIVDSVTLTLNTWANAETAVINGLTYTGATNAAAGDYATRNFSIEGSNDADAIALAALINADYAVVTAGTSVAGTDKLVITTDEGAREIVAAATADYPAGKYALNATAGTELASIVLAINHRDSIIIGRDASSLAADVTPTDEAQDYALSIELIADHNTHTALTTVHKQATAAVSTTAATTEETLVAQANATRTAMAAHYASTAAHNAADATNLALVEATTEAEDAATARTLITALAAAHAAHIATAQVQAGDTVTVNGIEFVAHASTTTAADHEFAIDGAAATDDADELCTCLNDATDGVGATLTAVNATGSVGLTRDAAASTVAISAAPATASVHSCITIEAAGGVPGVVAAATGYAGQLSITPTWTAVLTVTEAGDRLTVTDIDNPGILATPGTASVVLTPGNPGAPDGQELATCILAATGTAGAHCAVSTAGTLSGLLIPPDITSTFANVAANSTTSGTLYTCPTGGYEYMYIGIMCDSGDASAAAMTVGATKRL